ncbi:MAG: M48 family metallopeptidase [Desulfobaccales bacterium]
MRAEAAPERLRFEGLDVTVRRSRRRRSLGLTVTVEGRVIVAAPPGASKDLLLQVLLKHQAWIKRKVEASRDAWERLPQGAVFFLGRAFRLALLSKATPLVHLARAEMRVQAGTAAAAWPLLQAWYRLQADRLLRERVKHFARGLKALRVELREWRRRWGECHPQEALRFNWRLILLPPEILDYVVVHELAHLQEPSHNSLFWQRVEQTLPDYRQRREWLNRFGSPFLLWTL